jgi:serine beta-lactamase-like protein LACTB, mitochondrial
MTVSRRGLLLGSAALAVAAYAAPSSRRQVDAARAVIREILAAHPIPALSIAVFHGPQLAWAEAFGMADIEFDLAATTTHRFRQGSVSKVFTATLAAKLAAQKVVDLDASIATYLAGLPAQHHATTLRQLLTHRGGIRHYVDKDFDDAAPGGNIDKHRYVSNAEILALFINDPLIAQPGEGPNYSTFGYTLASLVLEAAARTPFIELLQREIATPLALPSLSADTPVAIVPNRVSGYHPGDLVRRNTPAFQGKFANIPQNNPAYKWAGGGLLATPTDVARFGAAHLASGSLSQAVLDSLFTVHTQRTERSPPLGLGWRVDQDERGRARWHHAGGQDGARASLVVYPRERLSIALATNVTGHPGDVNAPSAKIADAFAG